MLRRRPRRSQASGALPPLVQGGVDPLDLFGLLDQMLQQGSGLGSSSGLGQLPVSPSSSLQQIAAPAGLQGQDYYAEASVDKTTPYQGEQVLYTLRFYRALDPFGQIDYKAPAFNGAWSKALPDQTNYTTEAGGRNYLVTELQHVLFPTVAGEIVIDPARLTLPGDFLGAPGIEVASQPLTLDVQPLPAGAPASFQGAVGQFSMQSEVDKAEVKVGDAVTQRVPDLRRGQHRAGRRSCAGLTTAPGAPSTANPRPTASSRMASWPAFAASSGCWCPRSRAS